MRHTRGGAVSRGLAGLLFMLLVMLLLLYQAGWLPENRLLATLPFGGGAADDDTAEYRSEWPDKFTPDSEGLLFWNRYQDELAAAAEEVRVAVYSTHSSESYTAFSGAPKVYGEHGGVYAASSALAERLLAYGVGVYVDETIHDWPDWNRSYANSLETAQRLLETYPNLSVLIDMHRDAGVSRESSFCVVNGRNAAKIMLVVGSDKRYEHPNWQQNEAFMEKIAAKMEDMYPGLLRRVSVQTGRYNQHVFDHAVLVEMGTTENTIDEVEYAAQLLGDVLAAVLAEENEAN